LRRASPSRFLDACTLRQIAQRTGVSLADLTRLNPDLEAARLVVGSQIRVPQSASNRVVESSSVAINCAKLLIVQKPAYAPWGEWSRPDGGSSLEKLVVDRCASKSPLQ